jgi:hypothetical protein
VLERGQAGDVLVADLVALGAEPGDGGVDVLRGPEHDGVEDQAEHAELVLHADAVRLVHGTTRPGSVFDATANDVVTYGSAEHAGVLDEVGVLLATVAAEQPFWPGDSLLPALGRLTGGR